MVGANGTTNDPRNYSGAGCGGGAAKRLIVLPPVGVIERLCAESETRAQRKIFALLTEDLSAEQRSQLDGVLEMREGSPYSTLAWLRLPPGAPTARAILAHIERLQAICQLHIAPETGRRVHQNRLLQLPYCLVMPAIGHHVIAD